LFDRYLDENLFTMKICHQENYSAPYSPPSPTKKTTYVTNAEFYIQADVVDEVTETVENRLLLSYKFFCFSMN
jgi:hypothetical protein